MSASALRDREARVVALELAANARGALEIALLARCGDARPRGNLRWQPW